MAGQLNLLDPELLNGQIFGNLNNINSYGYLVTKKNEETPKFIPAKLMNDSILSKVKKCHMKFEFVFLSNKTSPSNLRKKYKMESRWVVQEVLTYRSKVWEVLMVDSQLEDTEFTLSIDYGYLLCKNLKTKMEKEINDPQSSINSFGSNMRDRVMNHGIRWYFF